MMGKNSLDELRAQIVELLCAVETLKKDHGKELEKLRKDLEEEKAMRSNLEVEVEKLKKQSCLEVFSLLQGFRSNTMNFN